MLNIKYKQVIFQLLSGSKFNLSPQEMVVALEAINALASDINAELENDGKTSPEKGGDPATPEASK